MFEKTKAQELQSKLSQTGLHSVQSTLHDDSKCLLLLMVYHVSRISHIWYITKSTRLCKKNNFIWKSYQIVWLSNWSYQIDWWYHQVVWLNTRIQSIKFSQSRFVNSTCLMFVKSDLCLRREQMNDVDSVMTVVVCNRNSIVSNTTTGYNIFTMFGWREYCKGSIVSSWWRLKTSRWRNGCYRIEIEREYHQ